MDSASVIVETLENQELTDEDVAMDFLQQQSLMEGSFALYNASKEVTKNVGILVALVLIIYVSLGGLIWSLTDQLLNKKKPKQFLAYIAKFALITVICGLLTFIILMLAGSRLKEELSFNYLWLILLVFVFYFVFISYSLIGKLKLKDLAKQTFLIGIKKAHYILLAYTTNILAIFLFGFIMYLLIEGFILLLTIAMILFILVYVWARLFLVIFIDNIKLNL